MSETPGLKPNLPTPEGAEMGRHLARFVDMEMDGPRILKPRCHDCAFLRGTEPNACPGTLLDALACVMEKRPFYCHVDRGDGKEHLCAGFEALIDRKGPARDLGWPQFTTGEPRTAPIHLAKAKGAVDAHTP